MGRGRQNWRAFRPVMHLHENHYTKRVGVAGIRARASMFTCNVCRYILNLQLNDERRHKSGKIYTGSESKTCNWTRPCNGN